MNKNLAHLKKTRYLTMAEAAPRSPSTVSVPSDGLQGRTRLEKPLHKWLDGTDEAGRRLKYVLWGPGGVGKSTLALKFAAGQAERGGGWLRLVFRLSASSMEQDYAGLLDAMLGKSAGRAPSCAAEEVHRAGVSARWSPRHGETGRVPGRAQACCATAAAAAQSRGQSRAALTECHRA